MFLRHQHRVIGFLAFYPRGLNHLLAKYKLVLVPVAIFAMFSSVFHTIVSFDYIFTLKSRACDCSNLPGQKLMMIITVVTMIIYVVSIIRLTNFATSAYLLHATKRAA